MKFSVPQDSFTRVVVGTLSFITLFALLPWQPHGPFDARDWSVIEGVSVSMPWWQMLVEPFSALGNIITGAPDFRIAMVSLALWAMVLAGVWGFMAQSQHPLWRRGLWSILVALFAFWCVPAMLLFFSHIHFPGWQLQVEDSQWRVADLQTHTLGSHDGLVRAQYNLKWHEERGHNVVAITEHDDPVGSFYAQDLSEEQGGPLVIPGIEVSNEYKGFLLGLGLKPEIPVSVEGERDKGYAEKFTRAVESQHQGAVISMAWKLKPGHIEALADAGVHGFELMNAGHPNIPDSVRNEMLRLEREGRIRLVSSSDWHGWGGNARTWTLLRIPDAEMMSPTEQEKAVIKLLREGDSGDVIPVVAGYQGDVPIWRVIFAPITELARYAAELSPTRLLGWWLWGALLLLLASRMRAAKLSPARGIWGGYLLLIAVVLLWRGTSLYLTGEEGDVVLSEVTEELGMMAFYAAVPLLLVGGAMLYKMPRQQQSDVKG